MLPAKNSVTRAAPGSLLLSVDEATSFRCMKDHLPEGWVVDIEASAEMSWIAFVYCATAPRHQPMFTVCRWADHAGLLAQWMDGIAGSAFAFDDLEPVTEFILNGIFEFAEEHRATVVAHAERDTMH